MRNDIVKIANTLKDNRVVTVCYNAVNGIEKMKLRLGLWSDSAILEMQKECLVSSRVWRSIAKR